jgi:hypothetical protein
MDKSTISTIKFKYLYFIVDAPPLPAAVNLHLHMYGKIRLFKRR